MTTSPRERIEAALEQVATMLAEESRHIDVAGAIASRFADIRDAARELAMNQAFYADMKKAQAERDRLAEVVELQKGQNADLRERDRYLQQIIEEGDEHSAGIARAALAPDPVRPIPPEINALVDAVLKDKLR